MAALPGMAAHSLPPHPGPALPPHELLTLTLPGCVTPATLSIELLTPPTPPAALVYLVHPTACSAPSPGMHQLAVALQESGCAVVLADLLSAAEHKRDELSECYRRELGMLERRLDSVIHHVAAERAPLSALPLALVGSAAGAAVALIRETHHSDVRAVVSRGGLPHLADQHLPLVQAPVLLIVGSADCGVWMDNREALRRLSHCRHKRLYVVPNARHQFQETGAMDEVVQQTVGWVRRWVLERPAGSRGGEEVEVAAQVEEKGPSEQLEKVERALGGEAAEQYGETIDNAG